MATKAEKKRKASRLIDDIVPSPPVPIRSIPGPLRVLPLAEALAQLLVQTDPLGIITDDNVQTIDRSLSVTPTQELSEASVKKIINDPDIKMNGSNTIETEQGEMRIRMMVEPTGRDVIRRSGQFRRDLILPDISPKPKRTRKRTGTDKMMSKALRQANDKFRKANGQLRKGATQAQIMRYAHKLLKKMRNNR